MRLKSFFIRLLGALAAALAVAPAMAQTPADVLKPGTVFHFEATRDGKLTDPVTVTIISVVGDKVGAKRVESGKDSREVPDALCDVKFPLSVGASWSYACTFEVYASGQWWTNRYAGNAKVVDEESLTIAGQPVKAYKIDYDKTWVNATAGSYSYQQKVTRWVSSVHAYTVQYESVEEHQRFKRLYASRVHKIDLPAAAVPAAAPQPAAPAAPVATTAAAPATPTK